MTICIATDGFFPQVGGVSTFYWNLTTLLKIAGHQIVVLTIANEESEYNKPDEIDVQENYTKIVLKQTLFKYLSNHQKYFRPRGYSAYNWIAIGEAMREWLLKNNKRFAIDIIEVPDYGGLGFFLIDNNLPPVIITGHGSLVQLANYNYVRNNEQARIIQLLEQSAFQYAEGIIAHSKLNQENLEIMTGRKVSFATAPWINPVNNLHVPSKCNNSLLVVGGMQIVKGAITMAAAIEICVDQDPNIKLYWIGCDFYVAPGLQLMSVYIKRSFPRIWNKNFIWLNEQDREKTIQTLKESSFVIIPSDWETFNYVALEAAAFGKPVIISDKAGASYLFKNNESALIVPGKDPKALADAILKLRTDLSMQNRLGTNAKLMIDSSFLPNKILKERIVIYDDVIQNREYKSDSYEERRKFLNKYFTRYRKNYYYMRSVLKKLMGR
jgi:glycosyltransferase involved in cell wall biosynthesis